MDIGLESVSGFITKFYVYDCHVKNNIRNNIRKSQILFIINYSRPIPFIITLILTTVLDLLVLI